MSRGWGATALVIAGALLGSAAGATSWTPMSSGLPFENYRAAWGTSGSDVWIVGAYGNVMHYDGSGWSARGILNGTGNYGPSGMWGSSSSDIFVVETGDNRINHYNGVAWSGVEVPGAPVGFNAVWGAAPNNVIAVGGGGRIARFDGVAWTSTVLDPLSGLKAVWGSGPNDVFVAGTGGTILHFDGGAWSPMSTRPTAVLEALWGSSGTDVYAVGHGPDPSFDGDVALIFHYDGVTWSAVNVGSISGALFGVWGSGPNDVFAVGGTTILHFDGTRWAPMLFPPQTLQLNAVWGSSGGDVFAVGVYDTILHWAGQTGPNWIALGDSYSSGEGAGAAFYLPGTNSPGQNLCHRATTAYSQVSRSLPWKADRFFACSGAKTRNVVSTADEGAPQCFPDSSGSCAPYVYPDNVPQLDHAELSTAGLVTLTIGGNDALFADILYWCWRDDECQHTMPSGWNETLDDGMTTILPSLELTFEDTFAAVREKAPFADVRVFGYPTLFPSDPTLQACSTLSDSAFWGSWSPAEQDWLNRLGKTLNDTIKMAAANTDVRYIRVDLPGMFPGHEICGAKGSWFVPPPDTGSWPLAKKKAPHEVFHPTPTGHLEGYRRALESDLRSFPLRHPEPLRARARTAAAPAGAPTLGELRVKVVNSPCGEIALPGQQLSLAGEGFAAGASVSIVLSGTSSQVLRTLTANAQGQFSTIVNIPSGFAPQPLARLEAAGTGTNLGRRDLVAHLPVGPAVTVDQDGDGVPDACDDCPASPDPGQADSDLDLVGDACDTCPADPFNDVDGDGLCSNVDPCPTDPFNDGDGDGTCAERDNCPLVANPDQSDSDGDGWGDACDACPGAPDDLCPFKDGFETGTLGRWSATGDSHP